MRASILALGGALAVCAGLAPPPNVRTLKLDDTLDTAPPVFCLDVGLEIAFPSHEVEIAMGGANAASAGKTCLRSAPLNAVMTVLKSSLRSFSLHAVDCVLEPTDVESSTIALLGIASVCSRSNMEIEEDLTTWGYSTKKQVEALFESEKRVAFDQTTGMVRHIPISPAYELPASGNGLPQFIMGETQIWSEGDDGENLDNPTYFTNVQMKVRNDGKTPLHLYRLTLVEKEGAIDPSAGFVLPLVTPAVVQPDTSEMVSFKAITRAAVDSSKSYVLYVSHSGFRSHLFEGILDGKNFMAREETAQLQGREDDAAFDRFSLDSTNGQPLFPAFPYATWQVASMSIAIMVGLAVTLYIRRKRPSCHFVARGIARSLSPAKTKQTGSSARSSAKPASTHVTSSRAAISDRGEDHIEMESLIKKPSSVKPPSNSSAISKGAQPSRSRMPAITMKWKAPPPPPSTGSTIKKSSLSTPKSMSTKKWRLDLDKAARLHPKRFESMWDEYVERFQTALPDATRPDSNKLMGNMEAKGISCMASGTVNGVEKYVFYGKQQGHSWFFLISLDITAATTKAVLTVRASSDVAEALVLQLVELVKTTIATSTLQ